LAITGEMGHRSRLPTPHAGNALAARTRWCRGDYQLCVRTSVRRGGPLRVLRTPRITGREVAAWNRRARVPAAQCARHAPYGTRQRRPVSPCVWSC